MEEREEGNNRRPGEQTVQTGRATDTPEARGEAEDLKGGEGAAEELIYFN